MRFFVPNLNKEGFGGGNTFVRNYRKFTKHILTDTIKGADAMFVANPMWAERDDFTQAREAGMKIVMRVDNIPEDWNNRGTAIPKLRDYLTWADVVIYQSKWSEEKYLEFMDSNGIARPVDRVIYNGVDTSVFTPDGENIADSSHPRFLYVKSSRNENKRYPEAMEIFRRYWQHNKNSKLYLVGQFADDTIRYNFGFYNGENHKYLGIQSPDMMPMIYRSADILLFPAYADCAPNTVLEAMACGVIPIIHPYGGTIEYITYGEVLSHNNYLALIQSTSIFDRQAIRDSIVKNFDAKDMAKNYDEVFNGI